jgi:hypothetical protein
MWLVLNQFQQLVESAYELLSGKTTIAFLASASSSNRVTCRNCSAFSEQP